MRMNVNKEISFNFLQEVNMDIIDKNFVYTFTLTQTIILGFLNIVTFKKIDTLNTRFRETVTTFNTLRHARKKV